MISLFNKKCLLSFIIFNICLIEISICSNEKPNTAPQLLETPAWVSEPCSRKEPNKDNCFKKFFESMFPYLAKGIPEAGIEPFEPLSIDAVNVARGEGGLQLIGGFRNLMIGGPSNATVKKASLDLTKMTLDFDLILPKLDINAIYNLRGNILLLPLVGNGDAKITLKDVRTTVRTKISLQNLPEEAIQMENMKVTFLVGGMRIHLTNLFNGNQLLGSSLNLFLNQNSNEVISELRNDLELGFATIFNNIWNSVFTKIPLKYWLA